jgi:hypothetical protein
MAASDFDFLGAICNHLITEKLLPRPASSAGPSFFRRPKTPEAPYKANLPARYA